jgi:hypothetical protein
MTLQYSRDGVGLDGSGVLVAAETNVLFHDRVDANMIELRFVSIH